jgi:hypothetical protein
MKLSNGRPEIIQQLEAPAWALDGEDIPASDLEKLKNNLLQKEPDFSCFVNAVEVALFNYAREEWEWEIRKNIYDEHKKPRGRKKKPLDEHAGEELEEILKTFMAAFDSILKAKPMAEYRLEEKLRSKVGDRFDKMALIKREDDKPGHFLAANYPTLNGIMTVLWHVIDAIDHTKTEGNSEKPTLLQLIGRGRPKGKKLELVQDIGRQYRYLLKRIPTIIEMTALFEIFFGTTNSFEQPIKKWHAEAYKTPWESEKYYNLSK